MQTYYCPAVSAVSSLAAQLKALRYQFEMILEGEEQLDNCRSELAACETKEAKHRRELKKAATGDRLQAELKLTASERAKSAAHSEGEADLKRT